jgi:hypothetical protein
MDPDEALFMRPSKKPFPTFVLVFAYRHEDQTTLLRRVIETYFAPGTTIQLVLGVKVYDDKKYLVQLLHRNGRAKGCSTLLQTGLLPTDEVTDIQMTLPAEALFWGCHFKSQEKDYVLPLESLRYILASTEED